MADDVSHEPRELPRTVAPRRYLPLQDRLFILVLVIQVVGIFLTLEWHQERFEARQLAQETQVARHLASLGQGSPVRREALGATCASEGTACRVKGQDEDAIAIFPAATSPSGLLITQPSLETVLGKQSRGPSTLALALMAGLLLSFAMRQVMSHFVFKGIDVMTRVVFARRIFARTGGVARDLSGREFDGRFHFFRVGRGRMRAWLDELGELLSGGSARDGVRPLPSRKSINIVSQPEPPKMPLDAFPHNELRQLASAIEEAHVREMRWARLLQDLLEAMPLPVAALSRDGRVVHVNRKFIDRTSGRIPRPDEEAMPIDGLLRRVFHFPPELTEIVVRVLEQTHPRIVAREYEFQIEAHPETIAVSVSALSRLGKRVAIIVLHDHHAARQLRMSEVVAGLATRQIDLIQAIADQALRPSPLSQLTILRKCELLKDQINTLFDYINHDSEQSRADNIEFNLHALIHSLQESAAHTQPFELGIDAGVPIHVFGNPMHLRQYTLAVLTEYFAHNREPARVQVIHRSETSETSVSLRGPAGLQLINQSPHLIFLQRLATSYGYRVLSPGRSDRGEFFVFSFHTVPVAAHKPHFTWLDTQTRLADKSVLVCVGEPLADEDSLETCRKIHCAQIEFLPLAQLQERLVSGSLVDAAVLTPGAGHWQSDPELLKSVSLLRKRAIPALLIPPTPRRGDCADAQKAGFSAYLRSPVSVRELESLLQILCNKDVLSDLLPHGLITRHLVQELADEFGSCLVAEQGPESQEVAQILEQTLLSLALKVVRRSSRAAFFEALYNERFSHVFYPSRLSLGFRRQLSLGIRGKTAICYAVGQETVNISSEIPFVREASNPEDVLQALRSAQRSQPIVEPFVVEDDEGGAQEAS